MAEADLADHHDAHALYVKGADGDGDDDCDDDDDGVDSGAWWDAEDVDGMRW